MYLHPRDTAVPVTYQKYVKRGYYTHTCQNVVRVTEMHLITRRNPGSAKLDRYVLEGLAASPSTTVSFLERYLKARTF